MEQGLTAKKEMQLAKQPIIESFVSSSEDGKWVIHKTTITDIKSRAYFEKVLGYEGLDEEGSEGSSPSSVGGGEVRQVVVRYSDSGVLLKRDSFGCAGDVAVALGDMALEPVEVFRVLFLDSKNRALCFEDVARGTLNSCLVHPREVFSNAVRFRCNSIITLHNHPSGDPKPSAEDDRVTENLRKAGEIVGIKLLDHIIVGSSGYYSYEDSGWGDRR